MSSTRFRGFFLGVGQGGLMTLTIPLAEEDLGGAARDGPGTPEDDVAAVAVLSPDAGGTVDLTGTYNAGTGNLSLMGPQYIMAGRYDPAAAVRAVVGSFAGDGAGFFDCAVNETGRVHVCCAKYRNASSTEEDRLSMRIVGDDLSGVFAAGHSLLAFQGKATGTGSGRTVSVREVRPNLVLSLDGTFHSAPGALQGRWALEVDSVVIDSGTWEGLVQ